MTDNEFLYKLVEEVLKNMLEGTMNEVKILRKAFGVIQVLYNFIEASTKRHAMFRELINLAGDKSLITLKSISTTRWMMGYC